jgi:hypothetical protein
MISKIISRAACLAELTSNPKSFSNCPDLHGGESKEQSLQPWQMFPSRVAAVEAFSKQPKPTHEQVLAQFKRNREQLAKMAAAMKYPLASAGTHRV